MFHCVGVKWCRVLHLTSNFLVCPWHHVPFVLLWPKRCTCLVQSHVKVVSMSLLLSVSEYWSCLLTHSIVQEILWKANSRSAYQTAFLYGNQRLIIVFTKTHNWTLSWATQIQFTPSIPIFLRPPILMSSSHLRLGLPSGLFPLASQPKLHKHPPMHATCPSHLILLDLNYHNNIWWRVQAIKFIMDFSPWSIFLPFRSMYPPQHFVLTNLQSMFLPQSERPSFAPIQYNWQNYSFMYFNLNFFYMRWADERFLTEWWQAFPEFNLLVISLWMSFWFVIVSSKY
jgi:hypothetical protein